MMSVPQTILFATGNPHKLREVSAVLGPLGITVEGLDSLGIAIDEPVEDGLTFTANAWIKARYYATRTGRLALADDSGLEVDALAGAPGVRSARYAGVVGSRDEADAANNRKLLDALRDVPDENRTARFVCVMALCDARRTWLVTRGEVAGRIGYVERGEYGFGYDPLFILPDCGCTTAELSNEEKNAISHRGAASRALAARLQNISLAADKRE